MNKIWGIINIVIIFGLVIIPLVRKVIMMSPTMLIATLVIAFIFSIFLVRRGVISKAYELYCVWKDTKEIENYYMELKNIQKTGFYTVHQDGVSIEISLSKREKNHMIDDLIRRCDLYINNHNVRKRLSKGSYEESISTVKTIRSLAEKMKCP